MKKYSLTEVAEILSQNEPRQIQLFRDLLPTIESPVPTMVELGAAEGFYSLLFSNYFTEKKIPHRNICLELCNQKIELLKENLSTAIIHHGYIGDLDKNCGDVAHEKAAGLPPRHTLQQIFESNNLTGIDYLHVDIQGGEDGLVDELTNNPLTQKIKYFFVSTHDVIVPNVHRKCFNLLKQFTIIVNSTDGWEKWGYNDGLIIAENVNYKP